MNSRNLARHVKPGLIVATGCAIAVVLAACQSAAPGELVTREVGKLEAAVAEDPGDAGRHVELALLYSQSGWQSKAIRELEKALELIPGLQGALVALGDIYMEMERFGEALEFYDQVVEINEDNPMRGVSRQLEGVLYFRGVALFNLGRIDEAIDSYHDALTIDRTNADSWYGLGMAFEHAGRCEDAIGGYRSAIRFAPSFVEAYQGMARCYEKAGQDDLALYANAMISYSLGRAEEAIERLLLVVAALPDFADAFLGLGLAYEISGDEQNAADAYREALRLDPDLWLAKVKTRALGGQ